jgi:hypothetical protein
MTDYKMTDEKRKMLTEFPNYQDADRDKMEYFNSIATGKIIEKGYLKFLIREHPQANSKGYVKASRLMAETIYKDELTNNSVIHHKNKNTLDDRCCNLMVFKNNSEHRKYHAKINALEKSGNESYRPCVYCKQYDDPKNLIAIKTGGHYHRNCAKEYNNKYNHEVRRCDNV